MFHKSVPQECPTRVSYKSVLQESPTRVSRKSVPQEFPTRVTHKSVPQECPTRVSFGQTETELEPPESTNLRPRGGGRKLALQNGKVEGSEVGKNTALFLEAGVKSPLYVALCPDPPAREEREERQRGERERGERDERDEKEMREMREMRERETVRQ